MVFLNLRYCGALHYLPNELGGLPSLTELLLDHSDIREIPDWWGTENLGNPHVQTSPSAKAGDSLNCLTSLVTLSLDRTLITHLPDSIGSLTNLECLSLKGCSQIEKLPYSIKELRSLTELDLSHIGRTDLPDSMESLENLKALKLCMYESADVSSLPKLPESLTSLAFLSLRQIAFPDLSNLINLKLLMLFVATVLEIPGPSELAWLGRLTKLEVLTLGFPSITNLPPELGALPHLKTLQLFNCFALECIPQIPSGVTKLHIGDCRSLTTLDISYLKNLSELYVLGSPVEDLYGSELSDNLEERKISRDYGVGSRISFMEIYYQGIPEAVRLRAKRRMCMLIQND
ncbi:disease resistance protein RPV1-like [Rhodamnia argentea]|uniref:Disease resistance protein RPV1-like n=1 Tax=Rhodamnia argentea TaxID=178133 RepID=A0ABM3HBW6_9MYRT|nr:disease resistance protein RPV1-like [Rhodamnia argentea]